MIPYDTELKDTTLNDVLCYVSTARNTLSKDQILVRACAFYKPEVVKKAKSIICFIAKEKNVVRKSCDAHPNPTFADIGDIYECLVKIENEGINCPKFVGGGFDSFPPNVAEVLSPVLCSLRDEICALRTEVAEVKKINNYDARSLNNVNIIAQEVSEIKTLVQEKKNGVGSSNHVRVASKEAVSEDVNQLPPAESQVNSNEVESLDTHEGEFTLVENRRPYSNALRRTGANPRRGRGSRQATAPTERQKDLPRSNISRMRTHHNVVKGTKASTSGGLASTEKVFDVYVGGCSPDSTVQQMEEFCVGNGITLKRCELLSQNNDWVKSYKISIRAQDRDKLLEGDFWPEGLYVRKFYKARAQKGRD